jgi:hypothetical protein
VAHGFFYTKPDWHRKHVHVVHKPVHVVQHQVVPGKWRPQKHVVSKPYVRVPESQRQPIIRPHNMPAASGFSPQRRDFARPQRQPQARPQAQGQPRPQARAQPRAEARGQPPMMLQRQAAPQQPPRQIGNGGGSGGFRMQQGGGSGGFRMQGRGGGGGRG